MLLPYTQNDSQLYVRAAPKNDDLEPDIGWPVGGEDADIVANEHPESQQRCERDDSVVVYS